jgi:glycosyltransferase involved in cell wall biosynthesis
MFAGTLTAKKGVVPLIDAWNSIGAAFPDVALHLFGKDGVSPAGGSMKEHLLERLAPELRSRVTFHGHVARQRVLGFLEEAAVAVFPSFAEAFPLAPLEAMAAGCPTIASALGSGPELISCGVDGLTVDPNESGQIGRAIALLLQDEAYARALGEGGRVKVVRAFSLEAMTITNLEFFATCIRRHAGVRFPTAAPSTGVASGC